MPSHAELPAPRVAAVPVPAQMSLPVEPAPAEPVVEATPIPHVPQVIASFAPPPATYQVVSEHDVAAEAQSHRPVRHRRQADSGATPPAEPLQLVETAGEKIVAQQPVFEDEAARKPVRRRRQAAASDAPAEPLQLVETAPGAARAEGGPPQA